MGTLYFGHDNPLKCSDQRIAVELSLMRSPNFLTERSFAASLFHKLGVDVLADHFRRFDAAFFKDDVQKRRQKLLRIVLIVSLKLR